MKTIIAGSRTVDKYSDVMKAILNIDWEITEVVSGTAKGADRLGERWASIHNVPLKLFPADWGHYGKSAGVIRNNEMAGYADALIALWNGWSKGTENMIDTARKKGLRVYIHMID